MQRLNILIDNNKTGFLRGIKHSKLGAHLAESSTQTRFVRMCVLFCEAVVCTHRLTDRFSSMERKNRCSKAGVEEKKVFAVSWLLCLCLQRSWHWGLHSWAVRVIESLKASTLQLNIHDILNRWVVSFYAIYSFENVSFLNCIKKNYSLAEMKQDHLKSAPNLIYILPSNSVLTGDRHAPTSGHRKGGYWVARCQCSAHRNGPGLCLFNPITHNLCI